MVSQLLPHFKHVSHQTFDRTLVLKFKVTLAGTDMCFVTGFYFYVAYGSFFNVYIFFIWRLYDNLTSSSISCFCDHGWNSVWTESFKEVDCWNYLYFHCFPPFYNSFETVLPNFCISMTYILFYVIFVEKYNSWYILSGPK